jgi:TetR/AcrR family transcriptional regulator, hemagglutinin/protease regulatory protein
MPHAVKARTRLTPADRRDQLLACAVSALAAHGVARATHAHVAARAGVSVPAVHSYFRTRDDLVHATLDRVATDLLAITVKAATGNADVRTALLGIAGDFDRAACTTPDTVKVWLD